MRQITIFSLLVALLPSPSAHADGDAGVAPLLSKSLGELMAMSVAISTNTQKSLSKAPAVVSLITAEDIRATGAANLVEVLQSIPGVYIRPNLFAFRPLISIRGASAFQMLLMVNGAPVKDLYWSSGIYWKGLPTSMIERVEIIRGPGSALFGSDASAGVINVITRTAGKIGRSEAGLRAGSFGSRGAWVNHGTHWNGFDIGFTADVSRTDGHRPFIASDAQSVADARTGTRVSYAPGYARYGWDSQDLRFSMARGNWRLQADYTRHGNVHTGFSGGGVLDPVTRGSDTRANVDLLYNNEAFARNWGLNAELRYLQLDYTSGNGFQENPPGYKATAGGATYADGVINRQQAAERRVNFEVSGVYSGFRTHAIRVGGGVVTQDLYFVDHRINRGAGPDGKTIATTRTLVDLSDSPYAFAPEKAQNVSYVFLQDVWSIAPDWELTAGARHDRYSNFGSAFNPRIALVWQSTDRLTTKLMHGRGFRAPSYLQLYSRTSASVPNAGLRPERSSNWDLAFSYTASKDFLLGVNFYKFRQSDVIGLDAASPPQYQNAGDLTARGVELEAQWQVTGTLRLAGNLTTRSEDYSPLRSFLVPRQTAYLRADWAFRPDWSWNFQANRIGRHAQLPGDPRAPIGAYAIADTTIRYSPRKDWEFAFSVRNLFDTDARESSSSNIPGNLPLPRRNGYAEVRFKY